MRATVGFRDRACPPGRQAVGFARESVCCPGPTLVHGESACGSQCDISAAIVYGDGAGYRSVGLRTTYPFSPLATRDGQEGSPCDCVCYRVVDRFVR